jgi:hypothetical protein
MVIKTVLKTITLYSLAIIICTSCSLQKRLYTNGFYTGNNQSAKKTDKKINTDTLPAVATNHSKTRIIPSNGGTDLIASNSPTKNPAFLILNSDPTTDCDTLFLKNGTVILAKIREVNPNEIKYKYCDNPDGPSIITYKSDIDYIVYTNGIKEVIVVKNTISKPTYVPTNDNNLNEYQTKRERKQPTKFFATLGFFLNLFTYPTFLLLLLLYETTYTNVNSAFGFPKPTFSSYINNTLSLGLGGGGTGSIGAWRIIALVASIASLVLCGIAIYQILNNKEGKKRGLGLAIVGAILSLVMILLIVASFLGLI